MLVRTGENVWRALSWSFGLVVILFGMVSAQRQPVQICQNNDITYPGLGDLEDVGEIVHNTTMWPDSEYKPSPCLTRFTVCQNCGVNLTLKQNNFRGCHYMSEVTAAKSKGCDSRCTYLFAYDPNYFNGTMKFFFKGENWDYMAASKRTVVGFCMSVYDQSVKKVNFRMTYHVKVKEMSFVGSSQETASPGTIRSVNFPEGYVTDDDTYVYMIESRNQDDYVRLTFDDWDLDPLSFIEFERANIERVHGTDDRPIVTSTRSWIRFKFSTGNKYGSLMSRSMGFKITYSFTSNRGEEEPSTNCGGYKLDSSGGVLQFVGPDSTYRPVRYDCVWVVKRQPQFERLYLRLLDSTVYRGSEWAVPNKFELHYGLSSDAKVVRSFPPENTDVAKSGFKDDVGFYIRLTGSFFQDDKFRMAYASYDSLPTGVDQCTYGLFTCANKRCIDRTLACDGADHCGDNSDETSCPSSSEWGPSDSTPFSLSISIIIPIVVAMILVIVICLFVVFLRRCQQLQRRQPARNSQVPSVSGRMARGRRTRRSQIRVTIQQEYEDAPPTYEEAIGTPPNLGYFNMAFMWSHPDIPTGLVSPPPYADVVGTPDEENEGSSSYPIENDPNRQLTATDSIHSCRGRERQNTQVQTHGDTDRQPGGQRPPGQQPGDLHIVLRRNSNTPSSGTNSLEHNHSLGRQPLRVPMEAVYGNTLQQQQQQQRNKPKDTASPQISVTNDGDKDTPNQSSTTVHAPVDVTDSGAAIQPVGDQSPAPTSAEATDPPHAPSSSQPHAAGRHRGPKAHRKRGRPRNPGSIPHQESSLSGRSNPRPSHHATGILYPEPEATVSLRQSPRASKGPRLLRQSYSQADIPTSVEWSGPPDPRRASSAGRLFPEDERGPGGSSRAWERGERLQLSPVPQEDVEPEYLTPARNASSGATNFATEGTDGRGANGAWDGSESRNTHREGHEDTEAEEDYRKRLSQSSQHLRLLLRRSVSEEEDMYV